MARILGVAILIVLLVGIAVWATWYWTRYIRRPAATIDSEIRAVSQIHELETQYDEYVELSVAAKQADNWARADMYDRLAAKTLARLKSEFGQ